MPNSLFLKIAGFIIACASAAISAYAGDTVTAIGIVGAALSSSKIS